MGPVLPATLLLGLMLAWSLLALLGTVDLDMPGGDLDLDVDLDVDVDAGGGVGPADGLAVLALKWLNVKDIPLVLWLGTFSLIWWLISACLWSVVDSRFFESPGIFMSSLLVAKNLAVALPITKYATRPMKPWFIIEKHSASSLVGKECEISSLEASPEFGQVKYKTEGSPLLLNVRTDGAHLAKGERVWITHYDAKHRVYIVSPTTTSSALDDE